MKWVAVSHEYTSSVGQQRLLYAVGIQIDNYIDVELERELYCR